VEWGAFFTLLLERWNQARYPLLPWWPPHQCSSCCGLVDRPSSFPPFSLFRVPCFFLVICSYGVLCFPRSYPSLFGPNGLRDLASSHALLGTRFPFQASFSLFQLIPSPLHDPVFYGSAVTRGNKDYLAPLLPFFRDGPDLF